MAFGTVMVMPRKSINAGPSGNGGPAICPWCSATLPAPDAARCPSCSASLRDEAEADIPGVTKVDHEGLLFRSRNAPPKPSSLLSWMGSDELPSSPASPTTFEPPDDAVRREMLRMELASLEAEMEAERAALAAELVEEGGPAGLLPVAEPDVPPTDPAPTA